MSSSTRGRESLYKYKGKTRGVEVRVKDKRLEAKKKREELLSNRRGVLVDINHEEQEEDKTKVSGGGKYTERVNKRREELIKWKQEREERKKNLKSKNKPIFLPSGSFKPDTASSSSSLNTTVHKPNTTSTRLTGNTSTTAKSIPSMETAKVTRKSSRIATRSFKEVETKPLPLSKVSKSKTVTKTTTRVTSKKKPIKSDPPPLVSHDDHVPTKRSTRSTDNKGHTSVSGDHVTISKEKENVIIKNDSILATNEEGEESPIFTAAWVPGATVATPSKRGAVPDFEKVFVNECFSPFQFGTNKSARKSVFTFRKKLSSVKKPSQVPLYDSMEEGVALTPPTITHDKGHFKKGHHEEEEGEEGCDLYKGHSDDSIEAINISVAHNNDYTNQQLLQEQFSKKIQEEEEMIVSSTQPHPLILSSDESGNTPDLPLKDTPLAPPTTTPTSASSSEYITPPTYTVPPTSMTSPDFITPPTYLAPPTITSNEVTSTTTDSKGHDLSPSLKNDLKPFYTQHQNVITRFNNLCRVWNDKLEQLEEQDIRPSDEVIDDIRTTVCQAQLLMRQKLKQYIDLVKSAEDPTAEQKTNLEDLQGFWDMVYFQVEILDNKFNLFKEMEGNNWTPLLTTAASNKPSRRSKRRASEVAKTKLSSKKKPPPPPTERQLAARAKREAARSKLRELKMAASARGKEEEEEEEQPVTKTPKQSKMDLISFSPAVPSSPPPSSPPSSLPPSGYKTPKTKSSTKKKKKKTPRSRQSLSKIQLSNEEDMEEEMEGTFVTKPVHINTSNKKMLTKYDTSSMMSPARRSKRLLETQTEPEQQQLVKLDYLLDLPSQYKSTHQNNSALL